MRYANTEIVVEVDSPAAGILVLNDVWHPWWRASVDDRKTEILRANVLFRAVAVPAGRHVVRFSVSAAGRRVERTHAESPRAVRIAITARGGNRGTPCRGR